MRTGAGCGGIVNGSGGGVDRGLSVVCVRGPALTSTHDEKKLPGPIDLT